MHIISGRNSRWIQNSLQAGCEQGNGLTVLKIVRGEWSKSRWLLCTAWPLWKCLLLLVSKGKFRASPGSCSICVAKWHYLLKRIFVLYTARAIIYLPFDFESLLKTRLGQILYRYLWAKTGHALWYLCSTAIGFTITQLMLRFCKSRMVLIMSCLFLFFGEVVQTRIIFYMIHV